MTDIALTYNPAFLAWDITLDGSDLAQDDGLETAAVLSLFCDRRANSDDVLPGRAPGAQSISNSGAAAGAGRRGWWGDRVAPLARPGQGNGDNPDRIGSRLWILWRERQLPALLPSVHDILSEALAWMTEDGWASGLDIAVSFPRKGWLSFAIEASKPDGTAVRLTQHVPWGV